MTPGACAPRDVIIVLDPSVGAAVTSLLERHGADIETAATAHDLAPRPGEGHARLTVLAIGEGDFDRVATEVREIRSRMSRRSLVVLAFGTRSPLALAAVHHTGPDDWLFLTDSDVELTARLRAIEHRCRAQAQESSAHRALQTSLRGYEELFDRLPCGAYESTPEGRFLRVNDALVTLLGYDSAEELLAIDITRDLYLEPDCRPRLLTALEAWDRLDGVELVFRRKDGSPIVLLEHAYVRYDAHGRPASYVGTLSDITGRAEERQYLQQVSRYYASTAEHRAAALEQANLSLNARMAELERTRDDLEASRQRYRTLLESLSEGVYQLDCDGCLLYANPALARLLGAPLDDIVGKQLQRFIHPDDAPRSCCNLADPSTDGVCTSEYRIVSAGGEVRTVVDSCRRQLGTNAQATIHGVMTDVTSLRAAESRATWAHSLLVSAFDQTSAGIMIADSDTQHLVMMNAAALDFLGIEGPLSPAGVLRTEVWRRLRITDPSGGALAIEELPLSRALAGEVVARQELCVQRPDGSIRYLLINAAPVVDAGGHRAAAVLVVYDITTRRDLEARLRKAETMESLGRLASGVAHDVNNFIAAITGTVELLLARTDHPELRSDLEVIRRASGAASGLSRNLLAFARRQTLDPRPVDVEQAVADSLHLVRHLTGDRIKVTHHPAGRPVTVLADRGSLDGILVNLCLNSRDALVGGGDIEIRTGVEDIREPIAHMPELAPGRYAVLAVRDDGPGMPPSVAARAFEPFFTTKDGGSGLGLASVYGSVQQQQGAVELDTSPGGGTTVTIWLPLLEADAGPPAAPDSDAAEIAAHRTYGGVRVLIADDQDDLRRIIASFLEGLGHHPTCAVDGNAAFDLLMDRGDSIDVVVTDMEMPGMTGVELWRRARQRWPHLGFVLCTGESPDAQVLSDVTRRPATRVLRKPFDLEAIGRCVDSVLSEARALPTARDRDLET